MTLRLGILGSTRGNVMSAVVDAIEAGTLDAHINIVISDNRNAFILERATADGILSRYLNPIGLSRSAYDERVTESLHEVDVDLVLLIGYGRILSPSFIEAWQDKILNVHPSLLPKHKGLMDRAVHRSVLNAGETVSGCTIHYVNEDVDGGKILLQKTCPVMSDDTVDSLKERVQKLEKEAYVEAIHLWEKGRL